LKPKATSRLLCPGSGKAAMTHLIHARSREEDAHLLGVPLQLLVLGMAEF
jgi:hypothetical protein